MRLRDCIILFGLIAIVSSQTSTFAQKRSEKRGVSESSFSDEAEIKSLSSGVSWYYDWGPTPNNAVKGVVGPGKDMDYVPMTWNGGFDENKIRQYFTDHPGAKYLLGFNEPNFKAQANMTPKQAAEIWPRLEKIAEDFDLELVGPALNYSPDAPYQNPTTWYDEFFKAYPNARVDYLALHCYMVQPAAVMDFIDGIAKRYNKKIWLTEFCAWDGMQDNVETYNIQRKTMTQKLEALELSPNVAKYAWFKAKGLNSLPYYRLMLYSSEAASGGEAGVLSELGQIYVNMSSFDMDHYYTTDDVIPATNYIQSSYSSLELNSDESSPFKLQWEAFGMGCTATYLIDVPEAGTYPLSIRIASVAERYAPNIEIYSDDNLLSTVEIPETGSTNKWETRIINIDLPAGKQRLTLKSKKNTTCKINWISLSGTPSKIIDKVMPNKISIRKEGATLYADTEQEVKSFMVSDMGGRTLVSINKRNHIDVSSISSGVYLVTVSLADGTTRTVKQIIE